MKITVMTADEQIITLEVDRDESVENLKALLEIESQVPLQRQQLLYNGKEMRNAETLSGLGVTDGDLVMMVSSASSSSSSRGSNNEVSLNPDGSAVDPAGFQQQVRNNPNLMTQLFQNDPELAQGVLGNDLNKLQDLLRVRHRQRSELRRQQEEEMALLYADPFDVEAQKKIEAAIRQRLRTVQLLKGARKVCTKWRRTCKDPAVWKVTNIDKSVDGNYDLERATKEAVDLSCGELIDITIYDDSATDDLLEYIVQRSSKLQRLCLDCSEITCSVLSLAVKRLPELEELRLIIFLISAEDIEVIGRNCPQLKSFMMDKMSFWPGMNCDDDARAISKSMPELRHLQLLGSEISDDALEAIRNGCPHLQSLDVQKSSTMDFHDSLLKYCNERMGDIMLFAAELQKLPDDYD